MRIVQYRYFSSILHVVTWGIVLFFPFFIASAGNEYKVGPLPGLYFTFSGIIHLVIFYTNAYLLYPKLLNRSYWIFYVLTVVGIIFVSVRVKFIILDQWFPGAGADARTHVLFPSVVVFIVSMIYSIMLEKIRTEKFRKENEAVRLEMELKLLRSQINPHFLFNVLTNLVSLARKRSDELEPSLLMLSGLMRYMLYNTGKKITLEEEVAYLENYIALQKLRFNQDADIVTKIFLAQEAKGHTIEPMLLIPFVENAFKHGIGCVDKPFIEIELAVVDEVLVFRVQNKFDNETGNNKDETSGIGLNNVRSRLALLYPGRHELNISADQNLFNSKLTLQLS